MRPTTKAPVFRDSDIKPFLQSWDTFSKSCLHHLLLPEVKKKTHCFPFELNTEDDELRFSSCHTRSLTIFNALMKLSLVPDDPTLGQHCIFVVPDWERDLLLQKPCLSSTPCFAWWKTEDKGWNWYWLGLNSKVSLPATLKWPSTGMGYYVLLSTLRWSINILWNPPHMKNHRWLFVSTRDFGRFQNGLISSKLYHQLKIVHVWLPAIMRGMLSKIWKLSAKVAQKWNGFGSMKSIRLPVNYFSRIRRILCMNPTPGFVLLVLYTAVMQKRLHTRSIITRTKRLFFKNIDLLWPNFINLVTR